MDIDLPMGVQDSTHTWRRAGWSGTVLGEQVREDPAQSTSLVVVGHGHTDIE